MRGIRRLEFCYPNSQIPLVVNVSQLALLIEIKLISRERKS